MTHRFPLVTVFLLTFCLPLGGQPYTLQDCKRMAVDNNATLHTSRIQEESARHLLKEARTYYFPKAWIDAGGFFANKPFITVDLGDLMGNMSFLRDGAIVAANVVQPVFMGGKIITGNKLAKLGVQASELFTRKTQDEVLAQTEEYFWTLVTLYEKRKTVAVMQEVLDSLSKDVRNAREAGILAQNDVLKVEIQRNTLSSQNVKLENGIFLCKMALARQMGFRVDSLEGFDIAVPPMNDIYDPNSLYIDPFEALAARNEYQLLQMAEKAAKLAKQMEMSNYLPQVGVGAFYSYDNFLDNHNYMGGVFAMAKIPLSDWWRGSHAIKQRELLIQKAHLEKEDGKQQLLMQIQQAWGNLLEAYSQIELADRTVSQAAENTRINREFFNAGTVSLTELMAAQGLLQMSYDARTEALKSYFVARSLYLQLTGR